MLLVALIAWGLWPKPVIVETGVAARGPLTVRVSEEGKTRVRNRYIVAAPVAGKMRRVPLKPGDEVKAGETLLTAIEPVAPPLLDPRARAQAEAVVSMHEASRKRAAESLEASRAASKMAEADRDRMRSVTTRRHDVRIRPRPHGMAKPRCKPPKSVPRSFPCKSSTTNSPRPAPPWNARKPSLREIWWK